MNLAPHILAHGNWISMEEFMEIALYDPDMTHPSYAGSCLAALTHYYTLFGEYPENVDCLQLPEYQQEAFQAAVCK